MPPQETQKSSKCLDLHSNKVSFSVVTLTWWARISVSCLVIMSEAMPENKTGDAKIFSARRVAIGLALGSVLTLSCGKVFSARCEADYQTPILAHQRARRCQQIGWGCHQCGGERATEHTQCSRSLSEEELSLHSRELLDVIGHKCRIICLAHRGHLEPRSRKCLVSR